MLVEVELAEALEGLVGLQGNAGLGGGEGGGPVAGGEHPHEDVHVIHLQKKNKSKIEERKNHHPSLIGLSAVNRYHLMVIKHPEVSTRTKMSTLFTYIKKM